MLHSPGRICRVFLVSNRSEESGNTLSEITDAEYVERELTQASEGMSYTLSSAGAAAVRKILALTHPDAETAKALLLAVEELESEVAA